MTTGAELNISVFLLAENRLLRESLCRLLNRKNAIQVVGTAACSPECQKSIATANPCVLLFAPRDGASGLELLRDLRKTMPALKVILTGMEPRTDLFIQAVLQGVAGYVLSDATTAQLLAAVRAVGDGQSFCPPELYRALFDYIAKGRSASPSFRPPHTIGLTRREQQLLQMISVGATNKEIAADLCISEQTVKNHVHRMMGKIGVSSRWAAAEACRADVPRSREDAALLRSDKYRPAGTNL